MSAAATLSNANASHLDFREALSRFASGVTIVTARAAGGPIGFTASGFTAVSLTPPLVLVCIDKRASGHDAVTQARFFGVSVLGETQRKLAERFAAPGDHFGGIAVRAGFVGGAPLLDDALANLECRRYAVHDGGDHTILVGAVVGSWVGVGAPLVQFDRRFGAFSAR
jgi:flavin reductase (DIM6/NTAB) family NADH-FMN oxidoreductase RutF